MNLLPVRQIAERILSMAAERDRLLVAIAGPPGAGKSTLSEQLIGLLNTENPESTALIPMDGYHYDNRILEARGLLGRKGAPETFNVHGLLSDLQRIRDRLQDVAVPLFDRSEDLARANAAIVSSDHRIVLAEGNYLLLNRPVWRDIAALFDLKILIATDERELERRLIARWLEQGFDRPAAEKRAHENDLRNARTVIKESQGADIIIENS